MPLVRTEVLASFQTMSACSAALLPISLSRNLLAGVFLLSCVIHMTSSSHLHHRGGDVHLRSKLRTPDVTSRESALQAGGMCPPGHYMDKVERLCRPCSACPVNQIIRRPCGAGEDTRCGPFVEFEEFQQQAGQDKTPHKVPLSYQPLPLRPGGHRRRHEHHRQDQGGDMTSEAVTSAAVVTREEADCPWRTLSVVLIVVLCCVCCCLVALVVCACRLHVQPKQTVEEPELLLPYYSVDPEPSEEPRYVDTLLISRPCLNTASAPLLRPVDRNIPFYAGSHVTAPLTSCSGDRKVTRSDSVGGQLDQYVYLNCLPTSTSACAV